MQHISFVCVFLALAAIENAVAVNPDLRLELYVHPQTREMICVCCSIYLGGGGQACGITFGTLVQAGKDSRPPSWNSE